ncbi:hypothetical protein BCR32DRAFT_267595 [Anaeromyces robustus]|uniref:Uncharacterized protein n=1 Tax=Anaeromyces robustus TaxID=1754192 RepID=A0A1Y1XAY5_9FUNG|nr:hypothetical protein BCR32DRAFT_267595 [Anaeromyces robustus]|eukprot:ORX82514.1 hypothetical protein BCR32DRAFT_267595 [Anaeromyces robustus]
MAGSSNYFSHSDDEENPFINRGNNDRNLKNKNNNTDNNYINNNKKNKRYVQNDISSDIENSSLITTQDRKRLKINGQYETSIYEKEVPSKNNNNKGIHNIEDISNNSTTETETDSYVNTPSKKPMIRNSNKYNNGNDNNINDNGHNINNNEAVDRTSYIINEKEKRNIAKDKEKKKKRKEQRNRDRRGN